MNALRGMLALLLLVSGWPVAAAGPIFADGFESGDVTAWSTAKSLCIDEGGSSVAVPSNLVIAALPNPLAAPVVTITAGSEGSSNLAANLKTLEPSAFARLTSILPEDSWWEVNPGATPLTGVQALALGAHTLIPGDQWRAVAVESGSLPPVVSETLAPTAIEASVNLNVSADITDIDEHPGSPDSNYIGADDGNLAWSVRLSFPPPSAAPATGTDCQVFLVRARRNPVGTLPDDYPTATASLYEGGVLRETIGAKVIQDGNFGDLLIFPWSASNLQTANGSAVEVLLEFEPGSDLTSANLNSVSWEVLHQSDEDAADTDTGWQTIAGAEPSALFGGTAVQEVDLPPPLAHVFLPAPVTVAALRIELRGDGVGYFTSFAQTPPRTPATAIDAGFLIVSPAFEFPFNFAPGSRLRSIPTFVGGETALQGSNRLVPQYRRREFEATFELLAEDDAAALFERLDFAGAGRAFLVSVEPNATGTRARNGTFLATVQESRGMGYAEGFLDDGEPVREFGYRFVEVL